MITGVLILIGLVTTFHWLSTLREISAHRELAEWEQTAPIGIIILLGLIAFAEVWIW